MTENGRNGERQGEREMTKRQEIKKYDGEEGGGRERQ